MQKLIRILDHNPHDADELNEYLSTGWEVVNFITFPHGTHFLIQEKDDSNVTLKLLMGNKGLNYKGNIEVEHPQIPEGSLIITDLDKRITTCYSVGKK
jgi:hypothetical protein